jgi:hypothetical protein
MIEQQRRFEEGFPHISGRRQDVGDVVRCGLDPLRDRAADPDEVDAVGRDCDRQQDDRGDQPRTKL